MMERASYEHFMDVESLRKELLRISALYNLKQTPVALHFAEQCHAGQKRKGPAALPYIIHPLTMANHAVSLGLCDDELLSAALLHDTCEDCGVFPEELPVSRNVREAVRLLTFSVLPGESDESAKARYFSKIPENRIATMTKLLDRCNNLSYMVHGFSCKKISDYIDETVQYVTPILEYAKERYREYGNALFLIHYQMYSLLTSIQALLSSACVLPEAESSSRKTEIRTASNKR